MVHLRLAVRKLVKTPFITVIALLSLALGIGANAAIFSIFDQILLRPLPVAEPDRLVNLEAPGPKPGESTCNQAGGCETVFSYPMFRDLQAARETGFAGLAGHRTFGANIAQGDRTVDGEGVMVSGSYFSLLGLRPALGRLLQPADDEVDGGHTVAVLSHRFWQNNLGGDPGVLNSAMVVNGVTLTVVGVAPRGFDGTTLGPQPHVFVPLTLRGQMEPWSGNDFENRRAYWIYVFGRLESGVTLEQAAARTNQLYASIINEVEAPLQEGLSEQTLAQFREKRVALVPGPQGQSSVHEESRTPLVLLLAITALVLLIACANIANLLLARGASRNTEMAVRGSMGATRGQLLRQLQTEATLLAVVGGLAGLAVARATLWGIASILPDQQSAILNLQLSPSMIGFTAAVALGTGILFGLYPAWHATRATLVMAIRSGSGQTSGSRSAARFRTGLVTVQIALSVTLLVAAGLFIRSLGNISRVELGVRTDNVAKFAIAPMLNGYDGERSHILFERLREELLALPGVEGVTSSIIPVLEGSANIAGVAVQGFEGGPDVDQTSYYNEVGPDYLSTLGIPLIAGREFDRRDGPGAGYTAAIVNEAFAEKFGLARGEVVGSFMALNSRTSADSLTIQIVGLAQNAKYNSVKDEMPPVFLLAHAQDADVGFMNFYIRTAGDPGPILQAVPGVLRRLDPNMPVTGLMTLEQQAAESVFMDRFISTLTTAFAVLATLLAAIGLYGVLAYAVALRTREIGLRMALGADTAKVRRMVLRQAAGMLGVGGVIGIAAALGLGRAAGSLLYELEGHDPMVFGAAVMLLAGVAFGAGYVPAFRASRVDPMEALRHE
ncbi:MAG: ABC transporter permease [Candidatus Longimicrobiales bacterium M2_2A_002]